MLATLDQIRRPTPPAQIPEAHRIMVEQLVEMKLAVQHEGEFLGLTLEPDIGERLRSERRGLLNRDRMPTPAVH
jgi:hypothetical protein